MLFVSTRGKTDLVCSAHAITRGLADDGGLFVPQKFPELSLGEIVSMRSMTYKERAVAILSLFLTDYTKEELFECADAAYAQAKFGAEPVLGNDDPDAQPTDSPASADVPAPAPAPAPRQSAGIASRPSQTRMRAAATRSSPE